MLLYLSMAGRRRLAPDPTRNPASGPDADPDTSRSSTHTDLAAENREPAGGEERRHAHRRVPEVLDGLGLPPAGLGLPPLHLHLDDRQPPLDVARHLAHLQDVFVRPEGEDVEHHRGVTPIGVEFDGVPPEPAELRCQPVVPNHRVVGGEQEPYARPARCSSRAA